MDNFVVSALKYRPDNFDNVIGQKSITKTLENAISQNQLPQALLFCGPRGVGKTTCARILAKKINTENNSDDFSYNIFELDAASNNGVDDIRNLIDQVRIPPQTGKYKVYIIDEVHMLSGQAFNAFLKTLEEPPSYAIFILATTEKHKVIPTILSRCQIYDFKKINTNDIKKYLELIAEKEEVKYEDEALYLIAKKSDGALRDALSIFDRLVNYTEGNITKTLAYKNLNVLDYDVYFSAFDFIIKNDITNILLLFNNVLEKGFNGQHFIDGFCSHFRDLLVSKNSKSHILIEQNDSIKEKYLKQSKIKEIDFILKAIEIAEDCSYRYKNSKNERLLVEICLMKLCSISTIELKKKITILSNQDIPKPGNSISSKKQLKKEETKEVLSKEKVNNLKEKNIIKNTSVSGLSLSSLKVKKDIETIINKQKSLINNSEDLTNDFTDNELIVSWKKFYTELINEGRKNLASILLIDSPKIKNKNEVHFTLTNNTNKIELEKIENKLINFLKTDLKNNRIQLIINVDKINEKIKLYTPSEKYKKLKSINPSIEKMRKDFKLNL
ncbi:MAG: DNA polymerase III subunit gamma/tau [Flavobacteriaceae bacterium]|nr:DNA polymerase III subunit gamma/tau [Flavobacteriaceae bacterium]